jgi:hypothetical protein
MLSDVVGDAARRFGDATAFVTAEGWPLSFRDLDGLANEVAAGLASRGIGEGDVVCLVLPSTIDYLAAYVGAARVGAITAGVNPKLTAPERAAVVATSQPDLVVTTDELGEGLAGTYGVERASGRPDGVDDVLRGLRAPSTGDARPLADDADTPWATGAGVLLVVDDLLADREATSTVLLREADAAPPVGADPALPRHALLDDGILVARPAPPAHDRELARQRVVEVGAHLLAEGLFVGRRREIHAGETTPDDPSGDHLSRADAGGVGILSHALGRGRRRRATVRRRHRLRHG